MNFLKCPHTLTYIEQYLPDNNLWNICLISPQSSSDLKIGLWISKATAKGLFISQAPPMTPRPGETANYICQLDNHSFQIFDQTLF